MAWELSLLPNALAVETPKISKVTSASAIPDLSQLDISRWSLSHTCAGLATRPRSTSFGLSLQTHQVTMTLCAFPSHFLPPLLYCYLKHTSNKELFESPQNIHSLSTTFYPFLCNLLQKSYDTSIWCGQVHGQKTKESVQNEGICEGKQWTPRNPKSTRGIPGVSQEKQEEKFVLLSCEMLAFICMKGHLGSY